MFNTVVMKSLHTVNKIRYNFSYKLQPSIIIDKYNTCDKIKNPNGHMFSYEMRINVKVF